MRIFVDALPLLPLLLLLSGIFLVEGGGGDKRCASVMHFTHRYRIGLDERGGVILTGGTCEFFTSLEEVELLLDDCLLALLLLLLLFILLLAVAVDVELFTVPFDLVAFTTVLVFPLFSVLCNICCGKCCCGTVELLECK